MTARRLLAALFAVGALLAFTASSALAERGHEFLGQTIGARCTVEPCAPGKLKEPAGLALNEATGNLYVVDKGNDRVQRFDTATGAFLGGFDGGPTYEPSPGVAEPTTEAGHGILATEEPTGAFEEPKAIAVDNSCSLHAPQLTGAACEAFDPSAGDVYVVDNGHRVVDKFGPTGAYLGQLTAKAVKPPQGFFLGIGGVAVNRLGEVRITELHNAPPVERGSYIDRFTDALTNEFEGPSHRLEIQTSIEFGSWFTPALAVDSEEDLYVPNSPGARRIVSKFSSTGRLLIEEFTPPGPEGTPGGLALEPATDDVYVDGAGSWTRYTSADEPLETIAVPGGHGSGLAVGPRANGAATIYAADSQADLVYVFAPEGPRPPTIEESSVASASSSSAVLSGVINPRSEPGEESTHYRFEYGPCPGGPATCASSPYGLSVPAPDGELAASYEPEQVSAGLTGLTPGTTYHARLAAENSLSLAPTLGTELVLTTQPLGAAGLPDHRAWELVSQPNKQGSILSAIRGAGTIQASAEGDAVTYFANGPTEPGLTGYSQWVQILSRRVGTAAVPWSSQDIATPHSTEAGVDLDGPEYKFFSSDLSRALVEPAGRFTSLSPEAIGSTPYLRTNFPAGGLADPCLTSCYSPLITAANVPEGTEIGDEREMKLLGASPDDSHVVFSSPVPLAAGAPPESKLYAWSAGRLALLGVDESGNPVAAELGVGGSTNVPDIRNTRHTVSADGRVVFTGEDHLYLRDTESEETVRLDKVQTGDGQGAVDPIYQDASADGSRVFFTDAQHLVQGASETGADLYECLVTEEEGELGCALTDLTAQGAGEGADVFGLIPGASEDGSSVYFVANGALTGQPNPRGEVAVDGDCASGGGHETETAPHRCNLYLRTAGTTSLVAVLSGADTADWGREEGQSELTLRSLSARVSPDGRYLAFMSRRPLTGYDNRDASSGEPDQEVFLYDSAGQGGLICASCNPTGARPHGVEYRHMNTNEGGLAGGEAVWPATAWIAANVPGWTSFWAQQRLSDYQSRYLSDSGRLFFNSSDALLPGDSNGTEDVYQFEPPQGPGAPPSDTCTESSPTFGSASGGCLDLISSGTSKEESAFMDASESGDDVFFLTSARLSGRDEDTALDLYDARVGGGEPQAARPVECSGDACQQPAVPPNDQTPGSLTFNGAGNVVECPKGKQLKKGRCVKKSQPKKKNGKKHKKKGNQKKKSKRAAPGKGQGSAG